MAKTMLIWLEPGGVAPWNATEQLTISDLSQTETVPRLHQLDRSHLQHEGFYDQQDRRRPAGTLGEIYQIIFVDAIRVKFRYMQAHNVWA